MDTVSLSKLFYEISGIKPQLSHRIISIRNPISAPKRFNSIDDPNLAQYRARQFVRKQQLTRVDLQFDQRIPAFASYRDQPNARDDYQEAIWQELLTARNAEGWGSDSAKLTARRTHQKLLADPTLFGTRARLFCDMVLISAGQDVTVVTPEKIRAQARGLTRAFLAQRDHLTASVCLLLEAMLASTHARVADESGHLIFSRAAIRASEDLLVGHSRQYDRSLTNLVLFQTAASGLDIAVNAGDNKFAVEQLRRLERSWQDVAAGDSGFGDWLLLLLLRSRSNYYLSTGEYDRCGEDLIQACTLYDRTEQNLPYLGLLLRICNWVKQTRSSVCLQDALTVYTARWRRNRRLTHLLAFSRLLHQSPDPFRPGVLVRSDFGARVAALSKENRLLRL